MWHMSSSLDWFFEASSVCDSRNPKVRPKSTLCITYFMCLLFIIHFMYAVCALCNVHEPSFCPCTASLKLSYSNRTPATRNMAELDKTTTTHTRYAQRLFSFLIFQFICTFSFFTPPLALRAPLFIRANFKYYGDDIIFDIQIPNTYFHLMSIAVNPFSMLDIYLLSFSLSLTHSLQCTNMDPLVCCSMLSMNECAHAHVHVVI